MALGAKQKKRLLRELEYSETWEEIDNYFEEPEEALEFLLEIATEKKLIRSQLLNYVAWELENLEALDVWLSYARELVNRPNWRVWRNNPGWSWGTEKFFETLAELGVTTEQLEGLPTGARAQAHVSLFKAGRVELDELSSGARLAYARAALAKDYDSEYWSEFEEKVSGEEFGDLVKQVAVSPVASYVDWGRVEPLVEEFDESALSQMIQNQWRSINTLNPHLGPTPVDPALPVAKVIEIVSDQKMVEIARELLEMAEAGSEDIGEDRHAEGLGSLGEYLLPAAFDALDDASAELSILLAQALAKTGLGEARHRLEFMAAEDKRKTVRKAASEALMAFVPKQPSAEAASPLDNRIGELEIEYRAIEDDELEAAVEAVKAGDGYKPFEKFVEKYGCAALIPIRAWYYQKKDHYPAQNAYHQLSSAGRDEDHFWLFIERVARTDDLPGYQKSLVNTRLVFGGPAVAARPALRYFLQEEPYHHDLLLEGLVEAAEPQDADIFVEAMQNSRKTIRELGRNGAIRIASAARDSVLELLSASKADVRIEAARFIEEAGRSQDAAALEEQLESERSKKVKAALTQALEALGENVFDELDEATVVERFQEDSKDLPEFLKSAELALDVQSGTLSQDEVRGWVSYLRLEDAAATDPFVREAHTFIDAGSADVAGRAIFEAWKAAGEPADQKWAVFQLAHTASAETLDRAVHDLDERASSNHRQAAWFLEMLRRHGSAQAASWLNHYRKNSVQYSVEKAAGEAWEELVEEHSGVLAGVDPFVAARGAEQRAIASGDVDALVESLEEAMVEGRAWPADEFEGRRSHDAFAEAASGVVFRAQDVLFQLADGDVCDAGFEAVELPDGPVTVAHPIDMSVDELAAWGEARASFETQESFDQLSRPTFDPADGHEFELERVRLAGLTRFGFKHVTSSEWSYKAFRNFVGSGIVATVKHGGFLITSPNQQGDERVEARLVFTDHDGTEIAPTDVDPRVFSESRYALARVAR